VSNWEKFSKFKSLPPNKNGKISVDLYLKQLTTDKQLRITKFLDIIRTVSIENQDC
jgi:hypothetical protein